jgi:predicted TIM-barrel fold metal-dependent hydrolase
MQTPTPQIIDAQIHLWGTGLPSNLSRSQITAFTAAEAEAIALMDEAGVDAAVIHPPAWDAGSTDLAFAAVAAYPGRFAIVGSLPLDDPASRDRIAQWRAQPGMLGLCFTFLHDPARQWLQDGTLDWLWSAAESAGVHIASTGCATGRSCAAARNWPAPSPSSTRCGCSPSDCPASGTCRLAA